MAKHDLQKGRISSRPLAEVGLSADPRINNPKTFRDLSTGRIVGYDAAIARLQAATQLDLAGSIISQLKSGVSSKTFVKSSDVNLQGKIFHIDFTNGAIGNINEARGCIDRIQIIRARKSFIAGAFRGDLTKLLAYLRDILRARVQQIMEEEVYDKEVEIIYYKESGKPRMSQMPSYQQSGNLMMAVVHGIDIIGNLIQFNIDDNLAPYWFWVDRGFRLFIPDGQGGSTETGMFIVGRPYMQRINEEINRMLTGELWQLMSRRYKSTVEAIGDWALGVGGKSTNQAMRNLVVEHLPSYGYGTRFQRKVGLIR